MRLIVLPKGLGAGLSGWLLPALLVLALGGCTVAKPRTDDPWEGFNRKMYAFNDAADKAVIRPVAAGYRKVTSSNVRRVVSNFYDNIKMPITIANNVLQGDPRRAAKSTGRFLLNTTLGFAGLFDPASEMQLPLDETDFGVTLAKWGLPEGPYLVLPTLRPLTVRDGIGYGVDGVMEAAARGAAAGGGTCVGLLPGPRREEGNPFLSVAIATGLGEARNVLIVRACDAFVAIGRGLGTLSEIALALRAGKPVVGLQTWDAAADDQNMHFAADAGDAAARVLALAGA